MGNGLLDKFIKTVETENLLINGVHVYHAGETAFHRWSDDVPQNLYSGAKTYTALAIGICQDEKRLDILDKVVDFFPEYKNKASDSLKTATIRDFLQMRSSLKCHDCTETVFEFKADRPPGEAFSYNSANSYVLARIVEKVSGVTTRDYLIPRLFNLLEIDNPRWDTCPSGHTLGGYGLHLKIEEFSRLGIALLGGGAYKEKRVVSKEFVDKMSHDIIDNNTGRYADPEANAGYGYHIWRGCLAGTWRADGAFGQMSIIVPDKNAVITITSPKNAKTRYEENGIVYTHYHDIIRTLNKDIITLL